MAGPKTNERPGTRAQVRHTRTSAYKAREVLNLIRGKSYAEASEILLFSERDISATIGKVLDSAVANAEHNDNIPGEELFVSACYADEGPTLKRWRPRARGRATRIRKRTSHITVIVSRYSVEELDNMRNRESSKGAASTRTNTADARRQRVAKSREREATQAVAASGAAAGAYAGSVLPLDDVDEMPEGFPIKGNEDSMKYHTPDSPFYDRTKAEIWFDSEASAQAAGFEAPAGSASEDNDEEAE